jgi:tetratricopeptide (TPR) repeat protein
MSEKYMTIHLWLGQAFTYDSHTPYGLLRDLLREGLDISEADGAEDRRVKLEASWSAAGDLTLENLHGLAAILAIRYPDDSLSQLEPQARRTAIFKSFLRFCESQTRSEDLVLVLEDTHWADDLSLELLEQLISALADAPIFILMLTRPVIDPGARSLEIRSRISSEVYTEVDLNELSSEEVGDMVQALLQTKSVPEWLTGAIVKRAEGNPFFIEEIINSFIEDGTLVPENGNWIVTRDVADIQVPDTVQAVLAARIDRLDPDLKHVIQNAAIVGRIFWQQLLTSLIGEQVDERLNTLAEQDFVQQQGRAALVEDWEWIFRHVLVQEVAYDSVLKEIRRQIHFQIAEWLEQHASDRLHELAPNLARHFEHGQIWDKAIMYLEQSADHSRNLYALQEALRFYDQAIKLNEEHPDSVDLQKALRLKESRGEVRGLVGEFESAVSDLNDVLESAKTAGDKVREHKLLVSLGMIYRRADDYEDAMSYLNQALDVARESGAKRETADVLYHLGSVAWSEGNNVQSTTYHEEAVLICRELGLRDLVAVQALHGRGEAYWFSGRPQMAIDYLTESLELARVIGDKSYESENLQMIGFMHNPNHGTAESEKALEYARSSLAISQSAHMDWHTIPALLTLVPPYIVTGEYDQALEIVKNATDQALNVGSLRLLTIGLDYLGHLYQELNMLEEAVMAHQQGVEIADEIGSDFWLPRLRANLLIDQMRQGNFGVGQDLLKVYAEARERDQIAHAVRSLEGLAELSVKVQDYQGAIDYANELQSIAKAGGMLEQSAHAERWKGEALMGIKDYQSAESSLKRSLELAIKIGALRCSWNIHSAFVQLYQEQGKNEEAEEHEESSKQIISRIADNLVSDELREGFLQF